MKVALFLCLSLWCSFTLANGQRIENITRLGGGEKRVIDNPFSKTVTLMSFTAKSFDIQFHSLKATLLTNTDSIKNVDILKKNLINRDHRDRSLLRVGQIISIKAQDYNAHRILSLSMVVESWGGNASLQYQLNSNIRDNHNNDDRPSTNQSEDNCRDQVTSNQTRTDRCQDNIERVSSRNNQTQNDIRRVESLLEQRDAPLAHCQQRLERRNADYNLLVDKLNIKIDRFTQLRQEVRSLRKNVKNSTAPNGWTCVVRGRHSTNTASAKTRGMAYIKALKACGLNSCGKRRWSFKYSKHSCTKN